MSAYWIVTGEVRGFLNQCERWGVYNTIPVEIAVTEPFWEWTMWYHAGMPSADGSLCCVKMLVLYFFKKSNMMA